MKTQFRQVLFVFGIVTLMCDAQAQSTFQNLGFESATVPPTPPGQPGDWVPVANGLPGWNVFIGGVQQTEVGHNQYSIGAPRVAILGPAYNLPRIEGNYSVLLTGSFLPVTISQAGTVPESARSLLFKARGGYDALSASLGGSLVPVFALLTTPSYTLYGGDISAFAGLSVELAFTAERSSAGINVHLVDAIEFSPVPIPEPGTMTLGAFGVLVLCAGRRRQRPQP